MLPSACAERSAVRSMRVAAQYNRMSTERHVLQETGLGMGRAAEVLGADLAYMGTRFTATKESLAPEAMKRMIVDCKATDILCENHLTGLPANYMIPSLEAAGIEVEKLRTASTPEAAGVEDNVKTWRDLWSAGHGMSVIDDVPATAELVARLEAEYRGACSLGSGGI